MGRLPRPSLLSVCCFNVCLRSASIIIGFIFLLGGLYSTVHNAVIAARATNPSNSQHLQQAYQVEKSYAAVLVSFAVLSGLSSYSSLLLVIGGYKDLPSYMLAWVWISSVYVACTLVYLIMIAIMCAHDNSHVMSILFSVLAIAIPALSVYFILVVFSYVQTFKTVAPKRLEPDAPKRLEPDASRRLEPDASRRLEQVSLKSSVNECVHNEAVTACRPLNTTNVQEP